MGEKMMRTLVVAMVNVLISGNAYVAYDPEVMGAIFVCWASGEGEAMEVIQVIRLQDEGDNPREGLLDYLIDHSNEKVQVVKMERRGVVFPEFIQKEMKRLGLM